jgi:hypothetical protein
LGRASNGTNNPRKITTATPTANGSSKAVLSTPPASAGEPIQSESCAAMDTTTESIKMAEQTMTSLTIGSSNTELTNEQQQQQQQQPSPSSSSSPKSKK